MTNNNTSRPQPAAPNFADLLRSGRLAWRLLLDPRVATLAKVAIPVLAGLYVLSPVDLIPDMVPVLGQLDDLAILALAVRLFIALAPPAVVAEHRANLTGAMPADQDAVDGDYRVIS